MCRAAAPSLRASFLMPPPLLSPRARAAGTTDILVPDPRNPAAATALGALVCALRRTQRVAIARFVKRANSVPIIAVLVPSSAEDDARAAGAGAASGVRPLLFVNQVRLRVYYGCVLIQCERALPSDLRRTALHNGSPLISMHISFYSRAPVALLRGRARLSLRLARCKRGARAER